MILCALFGIRKAKAMHKQYNTIYVPCTGIATVALTAAKEKAFIVVEL